MSAPVRLSWNQVLAWRMTRQFLDPPGAQDAVEVARRLGGVQAQVASAADLAVAVRQAGPGAATGGGHSQVAEAIVECRLLKTWAMRGTLHLLPTDEAAAYLAVMASAGTWHKPSWQRAFVSTEQLDRLAAAVTEALAEGELTRDELIDRVDDGGLTEHLRSGWGAVLKPLAWQGLLCHGPARGTRVTFARPDLLVPGWSGLPDLDDAARLVVRAYLGAHGPAAPQALDQWLARGAIRKPVLRGWFTDPGADLAAVEVDGEPMYARAEDVPELAATSPTDAVRLLPGFDQYVLGPGTGDQRVVPADRRAAVSRAAGWIAPVVVAGGRVAGTWEPGETVLDVELFGHGAARRALQAALEAETARIGQLLGRALLLSVTTV